MGQEAKAPEGVAPAGAKRIPGRSAEERVADYEMAIPSTMDEALTFFVVLPKKNLEQQTPDDVPSEPEYPSEPE